MARIPYVDPATASAPVREVFERIDLPLGIFRMLAHAETSFRPLLQLGTSILAHQELSADVRELAILEVARRSRADYEWTQHVAIAEAVGVTPQQIDAIWVGNLAAPCFDERARHVLAATGELIETADVSDATYAALRAHLSHRAFVELIVAVGFYMLMARVMNATRIDPDPPAGTAILRRTR